MLYIENNNLNLLVDNSAEFVNAAAEGDLGQIRSLLQIGIHPDTQGPKGWTALRKAAVKNRCEVALELLRHGASVDACNYTGQTALMMACAYGHYDMVCLLIFYYGNPNLSNCSGRTPLMMAASGGFTKIVGTLLDMQPQIDLNKTDRVGRTALEMSLRYGHENVERMLSAAGAVNRKKVLSFKDSDRTS